MRLEPGPGGLRLQQRSVRFAVDGWSSMPLGVMTTPQLTFLKPDDTANTKAKQFKPSTACSVYCAYCLCGRHFETPSREWICPVCRRHIVLDWPSSQHRTDTQEAP